MNKKIIILGLSLVSISISISAQKSCILWDKEYNIPVNKASVYTATNGNVKSTTSNEQGRVVVDFDFDKLTISHIGYKSLVINSLSDTLFLEPNSQLLTEIIVCRGEPKWIRPMLKQFIKLKTNLYACQEIMNYDYYTQNIGDTTLYKFESKGFIRKGNLFEIFPLQSTITYKDKTAGCDYGNLKNTLYHDFVTDMDNDFIKEHKFYVDDNQNSDKKDVVRILFKSQKTVKDSGYFCIDTVRYVVLSAARYTGLKYNVRNRTTSMNRAIVNAFYGHKYRDWQIDYQVEYKKKGNKYYLSNCRYSNYIINEYDKTKLRGTHFYHVISSYSAEPYSEEHFDENAFFALPKPFAMKIIMSKKETKMEKLLQSVNKNYIIY